jgi:ribonuclease HI
MFARLAASGAGCEDAAMPWIRRMLRGNIVWVRSDERGEPAVGDDGRVDILYKLAPDAKQYRASARNLERSTDPEHSRPVLGPQDPGADVPLVNPRGSGTDPAPIPDGITVYTDGACAGNPGPMGIGVVIVDRTERRELSEYLGIGTNNIAELTAILRALQEIPSSQRHRPIRVHSDSAYSIGLLSKNWKAKANVELVAQLRALAAEFAQLHFVKVKGHAGVPENERCDVLANEAVARGR